MYSFVCPRICGTSWHGVMPAASEIILYMQQVVMKGQFIVHLFSFPCQRLWSNNGPGKKQVELHCSNHQVSVTHQYFFLAIYVFPSSSACTVQQCLSGPLQGHLRQYEVIQDITDVSSLIMFFVYC